MSEPKRYKFRVRDCDCVRREHLDGKYAALALVIEETKEECGWVMYPDYARLQAEVERLTNLKAKADQSETEVERLKAEVERLRKAGDAMADEYRRMCKGEPASGWFHRLMAGNEEFTIEHLEAWNAAKDGKPSV